MRTPNEDEYDKHPERAQIKEKFQTTKKLFQEIDLANQFLHKQRRFRKIANF
jgi:hypothetical protein